MPLMYDRPKMSQAMYQSLKRHIIRQRKKEADMLLLDATNQRLRAEREELRRHTLQTLGKTKEEVKRLQARLAELREKKSKLFNRFKEVFAEESSHKDRQKEDPQSQMQQQATFYLQEMPQQSQAPSRPASSRQGKRPAVMASPAAPPARQAKLSATAAVFSQGRCEPSSSGAKLEPAASYRGSITTGQSARQQQHQQFPSGSSYYPTVDHQAAAAAAAAAAVAAALARSGPYGGGSGAGLFQNPTSRRFN